MKYILSLLICLAMLGGRVAAQEPLKARTITKIDKIQAVSEGADHYLKISVSIDNPGRDMLLYRGTMNVSVDHANPMPSHEFRLGKLQLKDVEDGPRSTNPKDSKYSNAFYVPSTVGKPPYQIDLKVKLEGDAEKRLATLEKAINTFMDPKSEFTILVSVSPENPVVCQEFDKAIGWHGNAGVIMNLQFNTKQRGIRDGDLFN